MGDAVGDNGGAPAHGRIARALSDYDWRQEGILSQVAERPGVYLFRNGAGEVLYVGKARDLRARLATYRAAGGDGRISLRFLERHAEQVQTIVTRTEQEALLLEDELIKRHQPPHNVRLKDDKSFLMIRIDFDERFPRLKFVRAHSRQSGKKKGRSRFFGPFASARAVRRAISDLHRVVPLRDCVDSVMNHRTRPCLKHQLGLCSAPCVGLIDEERYAELVERAARILAGDIEELEHDLDQRMRQAARKQEYELAADLRDRLGALRRTVERQGVLAPERVARDVLALARTGERALVQRVSFREGRLVESKSYLFDSELPDEELWHSVLTALYGTVPDRPQEIVLSAWPSDRELLEQVLGGVVLVVPRAGEKRRMLDLALENARAELARRALALEAGSEAADRLAELVGLAERGERESPLVIDCFDVSNLQGKAVVASRVRFRGGVPDRSGYRRFRVKSVSGQDDFQSMREVVGRSLRRGQGEGDLPDLIVVDGGPAQLASALEARDDIGAWDVRIVALAKARPERRARGTRTGRGALKGPSEERLFLAPDSAALELPRHSAVRALLERIRNEAHRFAIAYHRKERGKIRSRLDSIDGVGAVRRKALLMRFGSVQGIEKASVEELASVPGIGAELAAKIKAQLAARER